MESTRKRIAETYNKPLVALLSKTKTKRKRTKKMMNKEGADKAMDYQDPSRTVTVIFGGDGLLSK